MCPIFRCNLPLEHLQEEIKKKKKEKPKQVKEDRKTGLINKQTYLKYWNLSFGVLTCPIILILVACTQGIKVMQEEEALTWLVCFCLSF